jgi:DNA-binding NarL/FixJ family response regulator
VREPVTYTDRVPVPDLHWRDDDPASLYSRRLTHEEIQVINLLTLGYDFRDVASRRRLRQRAVKDVVKYAMRKLGFTTRYRLICAWECELFHVGLWELRLTPYRTQPPK